MHLRRPICPCYLLLAMIINLMCRSCTSIWKALSLAPVEVARRMMNDRFRGDSIMIGSKDSKYCLNV